jgi:hypothetical protein
LTAAVTRAAAEDLAAVSPAAATTPWRDGFAALDVESLASDAEAIADEEDGGGGKGGRRGRKKKKGRRGSERSVEDLESMFGGKGGRKR